MSTAATPTSTAPPATRTRSGVESGGQNLPTQHLRHRLGRQRRAAFELVPEEDEHRSAVTGQRRPDHFHNRRAPIRKRTLDRVEGLVLAKCDSAQWFHNIVNRVPSHLLLAPLIESAAGLRSAGAFLSTGVAQSRTIIAHLGEVDLLADLGGRLPAGEELLHHAQRTLIFLVASQGGHAPIGGVHTDINNLDSLRASSVRLSQLGFGGRAVIHPSHCDITNEAFTPTPEEHAWANAVIAQMSGVEGAGAVRGTDGAMLDEAVVRRARAILGRIRPNP